MSPRYEGKPIHRAEEIATVAIMRQCPFLGKVAWAGEEELGLASFSGIEFGACRVESGLRRADPGVVSLKMA